MGKKGQSARFNVSARREVPFAQECCHVSSFSFLSNHLALDRITSSGTKKEISLYLSFSPSPLPPFPSTDEDAKSWTRGTIVIRHREIFFRGRDRFFGILSIFLCFFRSPFLKNGLIIHRSGISPADAKSAII